MTSEFTQRGDAGLRPAAIGLTSGRNSDGGKTSFEGAPTTAQSQASNRLAIAGLVCGIVGTVLFNIILGPLAIIFGGVGWARANRGARHRGMAIAAVVLGVIDLIISAFCSGGRQQRRSIFFRVG